MKRDPSALERLSVDGRQDGSRARRRPRMERSDGIQSEGPDVDSRLLSCWAQVGAELL